MWVNQGLWRSLKARFHEYQGPSTTLSEVSRHVHVDHPEHSVKLNNAKVV